MLRVGRSKWFNLLWLLPIGFALLVAGVAVAQALRELPSVEAFVEKYPGHIPPPNGQEGIPAWAGWQHSGQAQLHHLPARPGSDQGNHIEGVLMTTLTIVIAVFLGVIVIGGHRLRAHHP